MSVTWRLNALAKTSTKQTLYRFMEEDSGDRVGYKSGDDPTIARTDRGSYDDFFSRPVILGQINWAENSAFPFTTYNPWLNYFSTPTIYNKLRGFSRLRCNLHIKVVVNGSPFRYGDALLSYRPLYDGNASGSLASAYNPFFSGGQITGDISNATVYPGGQPPGFAASDMMTIMARSQRPHFHILPQTNTGGEMILPFIYYKDAIPLTDNLAASGPTSAALSEMGTIYIENVVNLLSTASANASPVTVTIYCWAEDVELWGPTQINVQGPDEYEDAEKPSAIASSIADAVGKLNKYPVIGPYAMATQFAANCVSQVLKLFGWSNPPIISGVKAVVPKTSMFNPNPILSFQDDVVALDPKNELTVDPRTTGCLPADELSVDTLCKREAIFDVITWNVADAPTTALGSFPVTPVYSRSVVVANTATPSCQAIRRQMTPATYVSQLFRFWRGTFCLRIRAVSSQFHRGRLAIAWDPCLTFGSQTTTAQITDILDLATANELVFKVPFLAPVGMLGVNPYPSTANTVALVNSYTLWGNRANSSSINAKTLRSTANGIVYMTVLNELQCGDTTAAVTLVCSTWFEDMKFAFPTPDINGGTLNTSVTNNGVASCAYNNFVTQGVEIPDGSAVQDEIPVDQDTDFLAALYSGESVPSLRPLLHRSYFHRAVNYTTTGRSSIAFTFPRFPIPFANKGFVNSDNSTGGAGQLGTLSTNYTTTTPIAYITACYCGYRGSMVWKATTTEGFNGIGTFFSLLGRSMNTNPGLLVALATATASRANTLRSFLGSLASGVASSIQTNNGVISGVFPMYSNWRMFPGNVATMYTPYTSPGLDAQPVTSDALTFFGSTAVAGSSDILFSVAAGTDFNVFGFVNVPEIFLATAMG